LVSVLGESQFLSQYTENYQLIYMFWLKAIERADRLKKTISYLATLAQLKPICSDGFEIVRRLGNQRRNGSKILP
jgi:hypothetical protein